MDNQLDAIIIGYNEQPFKLYLDSILAHGEDSEGFKDLRPNYFDIEGEPYTYVDLLNKVSTGGYFSCDIPNLAAVYLCNFLIQRGLNAQYINLFQKEKEKLKELIDKKPHCIAITTTFYISNLPVIDIIEFIREINPEIPIVVGGVLVSNIFNTNSDSEFFFALNDIGADIYVLESQGELTLYNLVCAIKDGADLSSINNLIYRDAQGEMVMNPRRLENNSLDNEVINWTNFKSYHLGPTLQTRTARSCAFACAFCGYPERGGALSSARIDSVAKELDTMMSLGYVENVVFIDDTFNVPKGRFKELCQMLIDKKYNINWFSYYRCDHGDEEVIELMRKSGCKGVFLGIESGSQEILEKMNKRAKIDNYKKGIKHLKDNGILTFASFITGYPGETKDTINETIEFIQTNKPDYWRTMLWYCDPLTPVYKTKKEEFKIEGEGFKWKHFSMNSQQAANYIHSIFLSIHPNQSIWMPQYSFDFWIIPYLMGKGISLSKFKEFMYLANQAMIIELSEADKEKKNLIQQNMFNNIKNIFLNYQSTS